jgi:RNA methyltransferase, TrmH family
MLLPDAQLRAKELLRIHKLRLRAGRDATGLYYVEGLRQVFCALDAGLPLDMIVYCETLAPAIAQKRVRLAKRDGARVLRLSPEEFRRISIAQRASGVGAVLHQHWSRIEDANPSSGLCWIGLGLTRSAGNFGTMLRTAEAVGAAGIFILEHATDPFDEQVVRASMGGIFGLRLVRATHKELVDWCADRGHQIVGTSPRGDVPYTELNLECPLVLLFGEERKGLTPEELCLCAQTVSIPTVGTADSLNLGVAAGIVLFDILRRSPPTGANGAIALSAMSVSGGGQIG